MHRALAPAHVYNIAEPQPLTEAEWAAKVAAILGWRGRVIAVPKQHAPQHLVLPYNFEQCLFVDSMRIRTELGYIEPVPVEEALRRTIEWEKANPPQQIDPAQYDYLAEDDAVARHGQLGDHAGAQPSGAERNFGPE